MSGPGKASEAAGKSAYWRTLEEQAGRLPPVEPAERGQGDEPGRGAFDRRRLLQVMGSALAMAASLRSGTGEAAELVPPVVASQRLVPGAHPYFTSALTLDGYVTGVLVRHELGRPIKIEGNPDHPASLGASGAFEQAAILDLYDTERAKAVTFDGQIRPWGDLVLALVEGLGKGGGQGVRVLSGHITSPTLLVALEAVGKRLPGCRHHVWQPVSREAALAGARMAFGQPLELVPRVDQASVILQVEGDLLGMAPGHLRHAHDFASRRRPEGRPMSRLYAIEATPSLTGTVADHRFAMSPVEIELQMRRLAELVGAGPAIGGDGPPWLDALARDLLGHRGEALVHAGPEVSPAAHALALAINMQLGGRGKTFELIEPPDSGMERGSLAELTRDMAAGRVHTLVILGGDPAYSAPADLGFGDALGRVGQSIYLGSHVDATARRCRWHVPMAHELESWGDGRAFDGTAAIRQPQIRPLFNGCSALELVAVLGGTIDPDPLDMVRGFWSSQWGQGSGPAADGAWEKALRVGAIVGTAAPPSTATLRADLFDHIEPPAVASSSGQLQALFRPDHAVWDGQFARNGWLQELPRPLTRLTWDNPALIAPATGERLGLRNGDVVELAIGDSSVVLPVWLSPGQCPDCVTLSLGYGRPIPSWPEHGGGFDVTPLRSSDALWHRGGLTLRKMGTRYPLATTQHHQTLEGRDFIRSLDVSELERNPHPLAEVHGEERQEESQTLYPGWSYPLRAWGMAIDLGRCIGCGACVVACQAENNIPVVGKEQVILGREMHWIRIDRYYQGTPEQPATAFQPVPCMHCEEAPCEIVCPVQATLHDSEGLNAMVYNRCIGTRFCSNNCPYKVRRFNFLDFSDAEPRPAEARNPEVTVRRRGVMEKCTYCVQRIRMTEIEADRESRSIADGEIRTACQQACPTGAIIFGDINRPDSEVSRRKADPLDYALLAELNTRPRTTYSALVRNPNPAIEAA